LFQAHNCKYPADWWLIMMMIIIIIILIIIIIMEFILDLNTSWDVGACTGLIWLRRETVGVHL
jgi:hypothetical protein